MLFRSPVAQPRPAPVAVTPSTVETAPWEDDGEASAPVTTPAVKPASSQKAEDILAMIRNRQSK